MLDTRTRPAIVPAPCTRALVAPVCVLLSPAIGFPMYAVVKTGGKQYRVVPGDVIRVEKLPAEAGSLIELDQVLMLGGSDAGIQIGTPRIEGAAVTAAVLEQLRDDTVLVFKKKRRHNYRRKKGHRQSLTVLRIAEILLPGAERTVTAADVAPARPKQRAAASGAAPIEGEAAVEVKVEPKKKVAPQKKMLAAKKAAPAKKTKASKGSSKAKVTKKSTAKDKKPAKAKKRKE